MRRALCILNCVLAFLFLGAALALVVAPEVAERQFRVELERRVEREVVARYPVLAAVPDVGGLAASLYAKAKRLPGVAKVVAPAEQWAKRRYAALIAELVADLKIFTVTNAICFGLAAAAVWREAAGRKSLVLSAILTTSALVAGWMYLFDQDWLQTILLSSYYGWGYAVLVAVLAGALCDVVFNRGRIVGAIIEGFTHLLAGLLSPG